MPKRQLSISAYVNRAPRSGKRARRYRKVRLSKGMVSTRTHHFVRTCFTGATLSQVIGLDELNGFTYNGANTGGFNFQMAFTLRGVDFYFGGVNTFRAAMPNYTEFTNLYDQYRIDWVEVKFMFSNNNSSVNSPATVLPTIYLAKDYDDTAAAGVPELSQYQNMQVWQLGSQQASNGFYTVRVKPNVDVALYQGVTTGYARGKPMLIDTSSSEVPHYGIKVAWDTFKAPAASTIIGYLNVMATYHLTMCNTK